MPRPASRPAAAVLAALPLYLYRVLELNGDGDPLDHGVIAPALAFRSAPAADEPQADGVARELRRILTARWRSMGSAADGLVVRCYPLASDRADPSGTLADAGDFFDLTC